MRDDFAKIKKVYEETGVHPSVVPMEELKQNSWHLQQMDNLSKWAKLLDRDPQKLRSILRSHHSHHKKQHERLMQGQVDKAFRLPSSSSMMSQENLEASIKQLGKAHKARVHQREDHSKPKGAHEKEEPSKPVLSPWHSEDESFYQHGIRAGRHHSELIDDLGGKRRPASRETTPPTEVLDSHQGQRPPSHEENSKEQSLSSQRRKYLWELQ